MNDEEIIAALKLEKKYAYKWHKNNQKEDPNYHLYVIINSDGKEIEMAVHTITYIPPTPGGTHPEYPYFTYAGEVVRFVRNLREPIKN
jgi:hypothetical protein